MVTLCGGAATTRSPRPRLEMLATQCPRLRRLSGRAAALNFRVRRAFGPPSRALGIPQQDSPRAWGAPAPHAPWPPYPPQAGSARKPGCGIYGAASGRFSPTFRGPRLNWSAGPRADSRSALGRHVIALGATGPLYRALGATGLHPFWPSGPQGCIGCGPGATGPELGTAGGGGRILGPAIVRNNASARSRAELATMYVRR